MVRSVIFFFVFSDNVLYRIFCFEHRNISAQLRASVSLKKYFFILSTTTSRASTCALFDFWNSIWLNSSKAWLILIILDLNNRFASSIPCKFERLLVTIVSTRLSAGMTGDHKKLQQEFALEGLYNTWPLPNADFDAVSWTFFITWVRRALSFWLVGLLVLLLVFFCLWFTILANWLT